MTPFARRPARAGACLASALALASFCFADSKQKIAVFSGPTATIQNNKPLITSNKAREQYGLPLLRDDNGKPLMDWPRYQRLAAPVTVYIEMFTAHPLESQVAELYAAPDGYVNATAWSGDASFCPSITSGIGPPAANAVVGHVGMTRRS